jgi:hypothetical protein
MLACDERRDAPECFAEQDITAFDLGRVPAFSRFPSLPLRIELSP